MVANQSLPLGSTESFALPGITALLRVETHPWARGDDGQHVQGCFRVADVYLPADEPHRESVVAPAQSVDGLAKTIGVLTVVSLVVGTATTLAQWGK